MKRKDDEDEEDELLEEEKAEEKRRTEEDEDDGAGADTLSEKVIKAGEFVPYVPLCQPTVKYTVTPSISCAAVTASLPVGSVLVALMTSS